MNTDAENRNRKWRIHAKNMYIARNDTTKHMEKKPGQRTHDHAETITWIIHDGRTRRQIGYIRISQKYRNFATKTHTMPEWRGIMEQRRQNAALELELKLHFKKNYFRKKPPETGTDICYNTKQARKQPELLRKHIHGGGRIRLKYNRNENVTQNWSNAKNIIRNSLTQVYPNATQNKNETQIWNGRDTNTRRQREKPNMHNYNKKESTGNLKSKIMTNSSAKLNGNYE